MPRIVRIPILPLRIVDAHLLIGSSGCVLIDAGLPGSAAKVQKALFENGLSFKDIKAIVITHAHVDHAGGTAELRYKSRAPIIAHKDDLPYYKRELPMKFCPTGSVGRYFLRWSLIKSLATRRCARPVSAPTLLRLLGGRCGGRPCLCTGGDLH